MEQIKKATLDRQCWFLNKELGRPLSYFDSPDIKTRTINVGHFHLDSAYGQYSLCETISPGGGVNTIIERTTKRDLLAKIWVLRTGIAIGQAYQVNLNKKGNIA